MTNPYYNHQVNTPAAHTRGSSALINSELDKLSKAFDLVTTLTISSVSPALTGTPTAPTQTSGDRSTKIATDAFVMTEIDIVNALKAAIASPTFTGIPAGPTATPETSNTQFATTLYVTLAVAVMGATKAGLASPAFTDIPTAPTPAPGNSTTQVANTAFVANAIAGVNAQVPLTLNVVTATSVAMVTGGIYIYTNPAATNGTLPVTPVSGNEIVIVQTNGLKSNTYDTGAHQVTGSTGSASGVITMNDGKAVRLKYINDTVKWVIL